MPASMIQPSSRVSQSSTPASRMARASRRARAHRSYANRTRCVAPTNSPSKCVRRPASSGRRAAAVNTNNAMAASGERRASARPLAPARASAWATRRARLVARSTPPACRDCLATRPSMRSWSPIPIPTARRHSSCSSCPRAPISKSSLKARSRCPLAVLIRSAAPRLEPRIRTRRSTRCFARARSIISPRIYPCGPTCTRPSKT